MIVLQHVWGYIPFLKYLTASSPACRERHRSADQESETRSRSCHPYHEQVHYLLIHRYEQVALTEILGTEGR